MIMFAASEPNTASAFDRSADFDFHLTTCISYLDNNSNDFPIVKIDDIVWLQVSLHRVTVDSEFGRIRGKVILTADHFNDGAASNSDRSIFLSDVREANFTASKLNVKSACFVGSQSLGLFESTNEFEIVLEASVRQIDSGHDHTSIKQLNDLIDFATRWSIESLK